MAGVRLAPQDRTPPGMLRRMVLAYLAFAITSCVPVGHNFRPIAGLQGQDITIEVDPIPEGKRAPLLSEAPLVPLSSTPVEFDVASLPALDAVTNPAILLDPAAPPPVPETAIAMPPPGKVLQFDYGPSAIPYAFRAGSASDAMRAQLCLTTAIYYEAANEPDEGQRAVAQVVLNRVRHPAYPNTVCDVVYQGTERGDRLCQFSFACDGSMARLPARQAWARSSKHAREALAGYVYAPVGTATHYHTLAVNPIWNRSLTRVAVVGAHQFFRWPGAAGRPGAFYSNYVGREPNPGPRPHPIRAPAPYQPGLIPTPVIAGKAATPDASYSALEATLAKQRAAIDAQAQQRALDQSAKDSAALSARAYAPSRPVQQDNRYVSGSLPESDVRPEFRQSGQWIGRP